MIETERLVLRPWRDADRAPFAEMCASPVVMAHLGGPWPPGRVDGRIAEMRASQDAFGHCFWAVERKEDGAFLGFCGLKVADDEGAPILGDVEIGWRLRADAWGRGYAREGAAASLAWGWANLLAPRIVAITVAANHRSWGLMERLGMARRPDLDFADRRVPSDHPLSAQIVYAAEPVDA